MSKLSNKNKDKDSKLENKEPASLKKGLGRGLLAAVHDSMESLKLKQWKLEDQDYHGMESAVEIVDTFITNTIKAHEFKEMGKKLGPFAAEYTLHSFSLTFQGGIDHYSDQREDDKFFQKEYDDGGEEPVPSEHDSEMVSDLKADSKRPVVDKVLEKK